MEQNHNQIEKNESVRKPEGGRVIDIGHHEERPPRDIIEEVRLIERRPSAGKQMGIPQRRPTRPQPSREAHQFGHAVVDWIVDKDRLPKKQGGRKQGKAQEPKNAQVQNPGPLSLAAK